MCEASPPSGIFVRPFSLDGRRCFLGMNVTLLGQGLTWLIVQHWRPGPRQLKGRARSLADKMKCQCPGVPLSPARQGSFACHSFGTGLKWKTDRPPPRVRASSSWDKAHMRRTLVSAQAQAFVMAPVTGSRKMKAHGRKPRWSQIRWSSGGLLKVGGIHELSPGRCIQSDSPEQPPHAQYPTTRCMKLSPAGSKRTQKAS
jgi:hypothetical protein